ncbi:MAG: hypothetical protein AAF170_18105 [Bacteroidota bacterium]
MSAGNTVVEASHTFEYLTRTWVIHRHTAVDDCWRCSDVETGMALPSDWTSPEVAEKVAREFLRSKGKEGLAVAMKRAAELLSSPA